MIMQKDDPYTKLFNALPGVRMMSCVFFKVEYSLQQSGKTVLH